ncbi:MAG TPA: ATP phosphoribosyltransferase [Clostridia bacterium]|nr:ATP phosphoribosyltransferase [Clostridia bacterium]
MVTDGYLTIALAKGKLLSSTIDLFRKSGWKCEGVIEDDRRLVFIDEEDQVKFLVTRPTDVPTYVEYGAADLGVVGKDVLLEQQRDVRELLDLSFGFCRFVLAAPRSSLQKQEDLNYRKLRVATKYPNVTEAYFRQLGKDVEIIQLHGSIELAPIVGLADQIVDITSTGETLRVNDLVELDEIAPATARLIANQISLKTKFERIDQLVRKLEQALAGEGGK